jgi:hypothetical protein
MKSFADGDDMAKGREGEIICNLEDEFIRKLVESNTGVRYCSHF